MLKSIERMLRAFEEQHILYCHWKSNEHLSEALDGTTDLDILFDPTQRTQIDVILNQNGLKRFRATPLMQYQAIEDFIGLDEETARIWHLHLHYRMTLGEKHLKGYTINSWTSLILDQRIWDEAQIYTSSREVESILLLVRIAMKLRGRDCGRKLGRDDQAELQWLKERVDMERFSCVTEQFLGSDFVSLCAEVFESESIKKKRFKELQRKLKKSLRVFTGYSGFSSQITRHQREFYWLLGGINRRLHLNQSKASRRISPSGGSVIVFLGCDGAGKSTTLAYVQKELSKKIDVKNVYLGSGDGSSSLLRKPMKMIARKVGGKGLGHKVEDEYTTKKKVSVKSRLYSLAKIIWAVTLAQEKKKKLREITRARNQGMIVLCDRYPQTEVSGYSDGPLLERYRKRKKGLLMRIALWEYKVYSLFKLNPPDLTIKLMVPTDVAISRKPEMTESEIENKKAVIQQLSLSSNNAEISTDCDFSQSISEVMQAIWRVV